MFGLVLLRFCSVSVSLSPLAVCYGAPFIWPAQLVVTLPK